MKRVLLATSALVIATAAQAADLAYKAPMARPVAEQVFSWTGFYLGVNAGIGGDKIDYPFNFGQGFATGSLGTQSFGGFAGGQVGYNYQFAGGWVAGLEADIQWSNIRSNINANAAITQGPAFALDAGTEIKWFGTVRGRLGYTLTPQTLLYATGGYAYGSETTSASLTPVFATGFSRTANLSGFVVGGGLEYAMSPNLSLKTEYLFYDFGKRNVFDGGTRFPLVVDNDIQMHTLKAGLNYSFR